MGELVAIDVSEDECELVSIEEEDEMEHFRFCCCLACCSTGWLAVKLTLETQLICDRDSESANFGVADDSLSTKGSSWSRPVVVVVNEAHEFIVYPLV